MTGESLGSLLLFTRHARALGRFQRPAWKDKKAIVLCAGNNGHVSHEQQRHRDLLDKLSASVNGK
jgi:hypothetical protein